MSFIVNYPTDASPASVVLVAPYKFTASVNCTFEQSAAI